MAYDSDIVGWITRGGRRVPIRKNEHLKKAYKNKEESDRQKRMNQHMKAYEKADQDMYDAKDDDAWDKAKDKYDKHVNAYNKEALSRDLKYGKDEKYKKHRNKEGVKRRAAEKLRESLVD